MAETPSKTTACYAIAFTLRSGSNLLCDYLAENGLGFPTEYFQYPFGVANLAWYEELRVPIDDFPGFLAALIARKSQNGLFGTKLTWDHKNALIAEIRKTRPDIVGVQDVLPDLKWVYLRRKDKIGQTISLARAAQSGTWTSDAASATAPFEYDFFQMLAYFQALLTEEYLWGLYFDTHGVPVMRLAYEDFVAHPQQTILEIRAFVASDLTPVSVDDIRIPLRFQKQRDSLSAAIRERFLEDLSHIGDPTHWMDRESELSRWGDFFGQRKWKSQDAA